MLLAVCYIHSCGVVHRDLKLENFLYERKDTDFLKLIDFGFSKIWEKNTKMELSCGTLSYVAPEVLAKCYTSQCDLWSLGVIVFILLVGYMPFSGSNERNQIAAIKAGRFNMKKERWVRVSKEAFNFVERLLVVDPEVRMTARQALEHPWIHNRDTAVGEQGNFDQGVADALCNFAQESKFRRACMQLMAWSLSAAERGEVRQAFLELDKDNTGSVKLTELKQILEDKFHIPEDETIKVFQALDANNDDTIFYSEFLAAMMSGRIALHDQLLKDTFRRFDVDKLGYLSAEDITKVLGPSINAAEVMEEVDLDRNGKISIDEFMAYLRHHDAFPSHIEAVDEVLQREIDDQDKQESKEVTISPVRLRKRDKIRAFGSRIAETIYTRATGAAALQACNQ